MDGRNLQTIKPFLPLFLPPDPKIWTDKASEQDSSMRIYSRVQENSGIFIEPDGKYPFETLFKLPHQSLCGFALKLGSSWTFATNNR